MPKGGHARSGPSKDPNSRTSERAGYTLTALPAAGYPGPVPDLSDYMPTATDRHQSIWDELWKMPQAAAWSMQPWRWAQVADLVKYQVRDDADDAPAALATSIRRLRDDLGLTHAGLAANGWAIAVDELAEKRETKPQAKPRRPASSRDRMKVVASDGR